MRYNITMQNDTLSDVSCEFFSTDRATYELDDGKLTVTKTTTMAPKVQFKVDGELITSAGKGNYNVHIAGYGWGTFTDANTALYFSGSQRMNTAGQFYGFTLNQPFVIDKIQVEGKEYKVFQGTDTGKIEYNAEWMGASKVTTSITCRRPLNWTIGDHITYRGEKFYLRNIPTVKKISSDKFAYDGLTFEGVEGELANCEMLDTVLSGDTTTQYTQMPTWSVYCNDVIDFAERIKANIDRTGKSWTVLVRIGTNNFYEVGVDTVRPESSTVVGEKNVVVSISNESVWDSLKNLNEKFKINFYTKGRVMYIGATNITMPKKMKYGKGEGLFQLERTADTSQKVITRLYPRGGTRNMPLRFYQNISQKLYWIYTPLANEYYRTYTVGSKIQFDLACHGNFDSEMLWQNEDVRASHDFIFMKDISRSMISCMDTDTWFTHVTIKCGDITREVLCYLSNDPKGALLFFTPETEDICAGIVAQNRCYFVCGGKRSVWPVDKIEADASISVPNNVSVQNLMLAGFGIEGGVDYYVNQIYSTDKYPVALQALTDLGFSTKAKLYERISVASNGDLNGMYIESCNKSSLGLVEGSVTFDGSVDGYDDIYPSLQYTGANNTIVSADQITDDGVFDKETKIPNFHVVVNLAFDPSKYISYGSNSFTMHMQTGYCGGRDFTVVGVKSLGNNQYKLTINRLNDSTLGLYFPYKAGTSTDAYQIKAGDKYVLTDLDMPDEYVTETAVNALFPAAVKYLINNDTTAYKYTLKLNEVQIQRWCDEQALASQSTIHDTINAGVVLEFEDDDIDFDGGITIEKLTIKEGESMLSKYDVTLSNDKTVGTIQRMQNQIDSIASTVSGSSSTGVPDNIEQMIKSVGDKRYMRSEVDTTNTSNVDVEKHFYAGSATINGATRVGGDATFGATASSAGFQPSMLGTGWQLDKDGNAVMDSLSLRKFLEVPELRYNRVTVRTGVQWQTFGGGVIEEVTKIDDYTGIIKLKLEDGEYGAIAVNDMCMGIYHSLVESENSTVNTDDKHGNFAFKGFCTVYFQCIGICDKDGDTTKPDSRNQYFKYQMRSGTDGIVSAIIPQPSMSFAAYANPYNADRQSCVYTTTDYSIMLIGMTDWTFDGNNIAMIQGNMNGFSVPTEKADGSTEWKSLSGHGIAFSKAYMWGNVEQFDRKRYIVSQQIYYYGSNDSQTSVTSQWNNGTLTIADFSTSPQVPTSSMQYVYTLWKYTYSDDTNGTSSPACSAVYGSAGRGIESVTTYYNNTHTKTPPELPTLSADGKSITNLKGWSLTATIDAIFKYTFALDVVKYTDGILSLGAAHCTGIRGADGTQPNLFGYDAKLTGISCVQNLVHSKGGFAAYAVGTEDDTVEIAITGMNLHPNKRYSIRFFVNSLWTASCICYLNGNEGEETGIDKDDNSLVEQVITCGSNSDGLRIKIFDIESGSFASVFDVYDLKVECLENTNGVYTPFEGLAEDALPQGQNLLLDSASMTSSAWNKISGSEIEEGTFEGNNVFKWTGSVSSKYTVLLSQAVSSSKFSTEYWYTISWYQKGNGKLRVYFVLQDTKSPTLVDCQPLSNGQKWPQVYHPLTNGWERHSVTFQVPFDVTGNKTLNICPELGTTSVYIAQMKLEQTEKATTWQMAEADRKGADGTNGANGTDGQTYYTWIMYSDVLNPTSSSQIYDIPKSSTMAIGIAYNMTSATKGSNPSSYEWSRIKGENGADGEDGADGVTTYTWVKYSDVANPSSSQIYDTPKSTTQYLGLATNKTTPTKSTNPSDYYWTKIKGEQGIQGEKGDKGDTGSTGIQGCITRLCGEYVSTTPYYNDSALSAPRSGENVRVIDIVQWESPSGGLYYYQRTTENSGASGFAPTAEGNTYWTKANIEKFIATDILMSKEAWISTLTGKSLYVTDSAGNVMAGMQSVTTADVPQIFAGASQNEANNANFRVYPDGHVVLNDVDVSSLDSSNNKLAIGSGCVQVIDSNGNVLTTISQTSPTSINNAIQSADQQKATSNTTSVRVDGASSKSVQGEASFTDKYTLTKSIATLVANSDGGVLNIPSMSFTIERYSSQASSDFSLASMRTTVEYAINGTAIKTETLSALDTELSSKSDTTTFTTASKAIVVGSGANVSVSVKVYVEYLYTLFDETSRAVTLPTNYCKITPSQSYEITITYANYLNKILGNGFVFSKESDKYFAYLNSVANSAEAMRFRQGNFIAKVSNQSVQFNANGGTTFYNANPLMLVVRFDFTSDTLPSSRTVLYNPYGINVKITNNAIAEANTLSFYREGKGNYRLYHNLPCGNNFHIVTDYWDGSDTGNVSGKFVFTKSLTSYVRLCVLNNANNYTYTNSITVTIYDCRTF